MVQTRYGASSTNYSCDANEHASKSSITLNRDSMINGSLEVVKWKERMTSSTICCRSCWQALKYSWRIRTNSLRRHGSTSLSMKPTGPKLAGMSDVFLSLYAESLLKESSSITYSTQTESCRLKSRASKTAQSLRQLHVRHGGLLLLTGTPVQNNTKEIL